MSSKILELLVFFLLVFPGAALAFAAQSPGPERRPHFVARVIISALAVPGTTAALIAIAALQVLPEGVLVFMWVILMMLCIPALILIPKVLFRASRSPPRDDGGGPGLDEPPSPDRPAGGIPLPDAQPAGVRIRDHGRPGLRPAPHRRPDHAPGRRPARSPQAS
jgi:hypothetical protein